MQMRVLSLGDSLVNRNELFLFPSGKGVQMRVLNLGAILVNPNEMETSLYSRCTITYLGEVSKECIDKVHDKTEESTFRKDSLQRRSTRVAGVEGKPSSVTYFGFTGGLVEVLSINANMPSTFALRPSLS